MTIREQFDRERTPSNCVASDVGSDFLYSTKWREGLCRLVYDIERDNSATVRMMPVFRENGSLLFADTVYREPFYKIKVTLRNETGEQELGTTEIFLIADDSAPRIALLGNVRADLLDDAQRKLFVNEVIKQAAISADTKLYCPQKDFINGWEIYFGA